MHQLSRETDVLVVGSGAAALVSALRAANAGLNVVVIEKMHRYGGTTALSGGGLWIPMHGLENNEDTPEQVMTYLSTLCGDSVSQLRLQAYVDHAPAALCHLIKSGMKFDVFPGYPDYFPDLPGASTGRSVFPAEIDGMELGEDLYTLRDQSIDFRLFNRYTLNLAQAFALSIRERGWQWTVAKIVLGYWSDLVARRRSRRDRRLTMGNALIGGLRKALQERNVPIILNTRLERVRASNGRVSGVEVSRNGVIHSINVRQAVVLGAGGFEQNQEMRSKHFPVPTDRSWSLTPHGANEGDALAACTELNPETEFMDYGWWTPTMQLPSPDTPNTDVARQMFLDHRHPHSLCVNQLGKRFVNESCSYDLFGLAMIEDHKTTGANVPCWLIFDTTYRKKYGCGGILPSLAMPDRVLPPEWFDHYIFKADSIADLALKIDMDPTELQTSVAIINEAARTGVDSQFGRGKGIYDRYFGDPRVSPNPCLGPVNTAPYYAVRIDLGDIGNKGGFKVDEFARVIDKSNQVIVGLYAVGNSAASPFGNHYPGAGGTLGPAIVFGHIAAGHIATSAKASRLEKT